jgi:hypothetical protein
MRINALACAAALCVLLGGAAHALDGASDGTLPAAPRAGADDPAVRSAKSIECSQKADAQDLHGKPRKRFMRECRHGG